MNRILVVDDSFDLREMLRMLLETSGYNVVCAGDAKEAIGITRDQTFDVVLTDLLMPGGDGIELILALRSQKARTRIIVMSGGGLLSAKTYLAIAKGFHPDWLLHKPFSREELMAALQLVQARDQAPAAPCLV